MQGTSTPHPLQLPPPCGYPTHLLPLRAPNEPHLRVLQLLDQVRSIAGLQDHGAARLAVRKHLRVCVGGVLVVGLVGRFTSAGLVRMICIQVVSTGREGGEGRLQDVSNVSPGPQAHNKAGGLAGVV